MTEVSTLTEARDLILADVVCCYNCCKPVNKKYAWVGEKRDLMHHLKRSGIDEAYWQDVVDGLKCPICGALLDLNAIVEVVTEYDKKVEQLIQRARDPKLVQELAEFHQFLSLYPSLGLADPNGTGQKIMTSVQSHPRQTLKPRIWFRARRLKEGRLFSSEEMGAPDPDEVLIREGRYNHAGQSFLYLASEAQTALSEISTWGDDKQCAMQKFRATESIQVLDLRHDDRKLNPKTDLLLIAVIYNGYLEFVPDEGTSWRPEYFVPRFLADCARLQGYEAIWFSSVWDFGENLVVFPEKMRVFVPEGGCKKFISKVKTLQLGLENVSEKLNAS
jgi:hypothetical protein